MGSSRRWSGVCADQDWQAMGVATDFVGSMAQDWQAISVSRQPRDFPSPGLSFLLCTGGSVCLPAWGRCAKPLQGFCSAMCFAASELHTSETPAPGLGLLSLFFLITSDSAN